MVIRSVITKLCCPRYGNRGMVSEVFKLGERTVGPDIFFSLKEQEHIALPQMDLVRQSGLPRHSHAGVQKSALLSLPPSAAGLEIAKYLYGVSSAPTYDLRS